MANIELEMNRRAMLATLTAGAGFTMGGPLAGSAWARAGADDGWEWGPMRWVQICATDDDPGKYDKQFWLDFLRRTKTQGVCLSAGGVTAFYPTKVPFHRRSPFLGNSDMFGDLARACQAMDIRVLGRVDPHAAYADMLVARPDWIARDFEGKPKKHPTDPDLYLTCPNGPVTFEWMPQILTEIMKTYRIDGIFGNRWAGSAGVCACSRCAGEFKAASDLDLPRSLGNRRDPAVTAYIGWDNGKRYAQLKLWDDTIRRVRRDAFFSPGTWGMLDPKMLRQTVRAAYADQQARGAKEPAWLAGRSAKEAHCLMQGRPVSAIIAVGQTNTPYRFMDSVQSGAEVATYMHGCMAHGARPWMTKFKAEVFDKRWVPVVEKAYVWHARNERYFRNTANLASVAVLQSLQTFLHYAPGAPPTPAAGGAGFVGSAEAQLLQTGSMDAPFGMYQAMVESRVPFGVVDERELEQASLSPYQVILLSNAAALSTKQCSLLRAYVERGGSIVATHETSLYDELGRRRENFGMADLFGCDFTGHVDERVQNSYLSVTPGHPLTLGLEDTSRIIAGTKRVHVRPHAAETASPLKLVPSYPNLPMEKLFAKEQAGNVPMVLARQVGKGRVVYFPFDLDRTFWEIASSDHLTLLRNAVSWAARESQPMAVSGPGMIDISYWRQENSLAAHLVNLTNPMAMKGVVRELIPAGPYQVTLRLPAGARLARVRLLEADVGADYRRQGDQLVVQVPQVVVHEVVAIDFA